MAKTTHTHRGTCQACGHVQASANSNNLIAKHGYTVDWGYFNGTCHGSDKRPAEHDVSLTHTIIEFCVATAGCHDDSIATLKDGSSVPAKFERWNRTKVVMHTREDGSTYTTKGGNDVLPIAQATPAERAKAIAIVIHEHEVHARGLRSHANRLTRFVLVRLGQPLFAVADMVPAAKPAAPTVDVKAAKVTGAFATKAARKDALDKLSRQYDRARNVIQKAYLALPYDQRTEAKTEVYYGPYQLSHWRAKHSAAVLKEFPALAPTVTDIEQLVAARHAVKAAP